jgi:threonine/homoserine/homoserine lactone efflux protein
MLNYFITGTLFGLSAGLSPGPLLTLVISETLSVNWKAGTKVAMAPLVTDLPIILFSLFILTNFSQQQTFLGLLSFIGAIFIFYLGYQCIKTKTVHLKNHQKTHSLKKGAFVNVLNPHPYLFWLSVGAPLIVRAYRVNVFMAAIFLVAFYCCLVGSKIVIALLIGRFKDLMSNRIYQYIMKLLAIALWIFGFLFLIEGLRLLKII